jgi:DNA-directed RNA polymerase specialized sigma24 family protein
MTKPELLRTAYADLTTNPTSDPMDMSIRRNAFFAACLPVIRATVKSVLAKHENRWDDAESDSLLIIHDKLTECHTDPAAWVRTIARSKSLDQLRSATTRSKVDAVDDLSHIKATNDDMELIDLTPEQQTIARMFSHGASERTILAETGMSRRELKKATLAIYNLYKNPEY